MVQHFSFPKKRLSQNFLIDKNIAQKIVEASGIHSSDVAVEIGCGQGALTEWLVPRAGKTFGIEYDSRLIELLKEKFSGGDQFTLCPVDFLKLDWKPIFDLHATIKCIGNLPYHITSPILFELFERRERIESATIMIQKEVAERLVAKTSTKAYGILSVFCQYYADCKILFHVPPTAFFPRPKVDSSIVQLKFRTPSMPARDETVFRDVVRRSFNQRRKMLRNSLSELVKATEIDYDLSRRPEELSVNEFVELSNLLIPNAA